MKEIKSNSQRAEHFITAYWKSRATHLEHCYGRYSSNKYIAWKYCLKTCCDEHGERFRIISYNSMQFTAGWLINGNDLRIETRDSSYIIKNIELPF